MGTKTTRIEKWDNFKLLLIILVVIGHLMKPHIDYSRTARGVYWFIYLFHMPAFIMVSGMFAKRSIRERRYDRAFMFLVLYFLIKLLTFLSRLIMGDRISVSLFSASGTEWYAFALFVYYLLTIFLKQYNRKHIFLFALLMGCVAGYDSSLGDELVLARLFTFYPFFLLGYYMESEKILNFTRKKTVKVCAVLAIAAAALITLFFVDDVFWTIDLFKGNTSYRIITREIRQFAGLMRFAQYLISVILIFSVLALVPSRKLPVSWVGRQTLPIYTLHYMVIDVFYKGFKGTALLQSVSAQYYELLLIPIGIVLVFVLALKPFVTLVNRVIILKKEEED